MQLMLLGELIKTCKVSRAFHEEAVNAPYHFVGIYHSETDQITAWNLHVSFNT